MGQSSLDSPYIRFIMKMFVVLALAAVAFAEPEADPQVVVSGSPVSTVYNTPVTYSAVNAVSSPLLRAFTPYSTFNGLYNTGLYNGLYSGVYGSRLVHTIAKRDADADPAVVYTSGLPVTTYGAVSHVAPATTPLSPTESLVPSTLPRTMELSMLSSVLLSPLSTPPSDTTQSPAMS